MNNIPSLIKGGVYSDHRGGIRFVNDFDMNEVRRFYMIENASTDVVRAWRAHRIEQRWFYAVTGEFLIYLVKIDRWDSPNKDLPIIKFILSATNNEVLHIPIGYASWIQSTNKDSTLMIFGDYGIENAKVDDYQYPIDYFNMGKYEEI